MRKTDNITVIFNGNNNNVEIGEKSSSNQSKLSVVGIIAIIVAILVSTAVLTVAHICPDKLAGFVRVLISLIGG
jgi:hypothetical protein